jgi:hypothetical protein
MISFYNLNNYPLKMETSTFSSKLTSYKMFIDEMQGRDYITLISRPISCQIFFMKQIAILKNERVVFKCRRSNFIYVAGLWNIYKANIEPRLIDAPSDNAIKKLDNDIIRKKWKKAKENSSVIKQSLKNLNDFKENRISGVLV